MPENTPDRGTLHAALEQVEPGIYRAAYRGELNAEDSGREQMVDYHTGTDPDAVKSWVEQMATSLGYRRVAWDELPQGEAS